MRYMGIVVPYAPTLVSARLLVSSEPASHIKNCHLRDGRSITPSQRMTNGGLGAVWVELFGNSLIDRSKSASTGSVFYNSSNPLRVLPMNIGSVLYSFESFQTISDCPNLEVN